VLCLMPVVREVVRLGGHVEIVCHANYLPVFDGMDLGGKRGGRQQVVMFDGWLEHHPGRRAQCAAQCYADWWNLEIPDARPRLQLNDAERAWGREQTAQWRSGGMPVAAVFIKAGWDTRTYRGMPTVAHALAREGVSVVGFGDQVLPCCKKPAQYDVRQLATVVAACDLVVSGDSGPMHLAAAVGTPAVAVFCASSAAGSVGPGYDVKALEPEGMACWPCWSAGCRVGDVDVPGSCVRAVDSALVVKAVLERLRAPAPQTESKETQP